MKEFVTAARAVEEDEETTLGKPVTIKFDEREVRIAPATSGQIAILLAASSDSSSAVQATAQTINFFFSVLEDEGDIRYFKTRLLDRDDPMDAADITAIVEYLVEEWTARPTKQPSDFQPSQSSGGRKSTARKHRTHSTADQTVSTT